MPDGTIDHEMDVLRADFDRLRTDLVGLTKTITTITTEGAAERIEGLKQAADRLHEQFGRAAQQAKTARDEGLAAMERKITERPLTSVLAAFIIGLLFGKLLDR